MKLFNSSELAQFPSYSHGAEVQGAARTVYVAGQMGMRADGKIPESIGEQTRLVYENLSTVLREAEMQLSDVVKFTVFLTSRDDLAEFVAARNDMVAGHKPPSTLVFVSGLYDPRLKVEIEAIGVGPI